MLMGPIYSANSLKNNSDDNSDINTTIIYWFERDYVIPRIRYFNIWAYAIHYHYTGGSNFINKIIGETSEINKHYGSFLDYSPFKENRCIKRIEEAFDESFRISYFD